jgi:dienelactone hydrolase
VPLAAAVLAGPDAGVRCAALCYGPPGDLEPRPELPPLLVVRAGRDDPDLNGSIDGFVATAADRGLPVELVEVPDGHHAFDLLDDTDASRAAIRRVWPSCASGSAPDRRRAPVGWPGATRGERT